MANWFGVRCVLYDPEGVYEERITLWRADTFDEAVLMARDDATEYADEQEYEVLGFVEAYVMEDEPGHGAEVFALQRESDLEPDEYLDTFFDTGEEHLASLDGEDAEEDDEDD